MHSPSLPSPPPVSGHAPTSVRTRGILYCQKLMYQGVAYGDARSLASAIAKFDATGRIPSDRQRRLIMQYSAQICRARLWRSQLLLEG
ncbi:MAG: hypothetical protein AAFU71_02550 [Cyanobacteria bacterium J06632_22]